MDTHAPIQPPEVDDETAREEAIEEVERSMDFRLNGAAMVLDLRDEVESLQYELRMKRSENVRIWTELEKMKREMAAKLAGKEAVIELLAQQLRVGVA